MADCSPFDVVEGSFRRLGEGPFPLAVDGAELGLPFPGRLIPVCELAGLVLHPSIPYEARDRAMRLLVERAQKEGGSWTVAVVGSLLPGLRGAIGDYARGYPGSAADLEADVLVELVELIGTVDLDSSHVAPRLLWRAAQRAKRRLARNRAGIGRPVPGMSNSEPHRPWGHPDFVLAEAVRTEVISAEDADLIGRTRLEDVPAVVYAAERGERAGTIRMRRMRAERRLLAWLRPDSATGGGGVGCDEGRVDASFGDASRSPGPRVGPGQLVRPTPTDAEGR